MRNLNSLINLLNKLNDDELKSLLKFLKYYNDNHISKSSELVDVIINKKEFNALNIQKLLYGKSNKTSFSKLIDRLREKVLEVLLFNSNISKEQYPERVRVIFDLKKKLIQCDVLSIKGLRDDGDLLCRKIISKAEKYELFDIVVNALAMRQRFVNIRKNQIELKNIQISIQVAENKYKSSMNSQIIYNTMINRINNAADSNIYYNELKKSIIDIEKEYDLNNIDIINYYINFLKTELYQIEEDYLKAEECLKNIITLLQNKSIYSNSRMGSTLLNIANNSIHLNKHSEAIKNANEAKPYFSNNVFNKALVEEFLFYANFYQGNIIESSNIIKRLVNLPKANNISFNIDKWIYLDAVLDFVKSDYNNCINKLQHINEIDKDKEGWNINKRLLLIMSRIELKQFESADLQVTSLEKFIKRSLKRRDIRLRYIYILRILIKLINSNFDFNLVYESRQKYFHLLNSDSPILKWKIKSPELIVFDQWFNSKLIGFFPGMNSKVNLTTSK
jgi:hypothetical protein